MDLCSYLANRRGAAVALGNAIGVNPVLIRQWAKRSRPTPVEHCAALEAATSGVVMRWSLRPHDWRRIWPELAGRSDAPLPGNDLGHAANDERSA